MDIYLNTAGMSNGSMGQYASWASFLWDLRTNLDVTYAGTTSATTVTSGQTLIRLATSGEWASLPTSGALAITIDSNGGNLILLHPTNSQTPYYDEVVMHEIGHALRFFSPYGGNHSTDADDIMHGTSTGAFPVSTADAMYANVGNGFDLPAVDTADLISAAMRWDNDLFIPDIVTGGGHRQVQLDYVGVVSLGNGAKHTWNVHSNVANEEGTSSAAYTSGTTAYLPSIQSEGQDYTGVTMSLVGSQVQLDSWTLA